MEGLLDNEDEQDEPKKKATKRKVSKKKTKGRRGGAKRQKGRGSDDEEDGDDEAEDDGGGEKEAPPEATAEAEVPAAKAPGRRGGRGGARGGRGGGRGGRGGGRGGRGKGRAVGSTSPKPAKVKHTAENHRRWRLVKRLKLLRQTSEASGNQQYTVKPRAMLKGITAAAKKELAQMQDDGESGDHANVVRIGPIIGYSIGGAPPVIWYGTIDKTWTSGFARAADPGEKEKRMNAWLAKVHGEVDVADLAKHGVNIGTSVSGKKSAAFAHSEVDCASDPALDGLLDGAINAFFGQIAVDPSTVIICDALIAARSEPNAMCPGACSYAMDTIGVRFAAKVKAAIEARKGRVSANEAWGTLVTSKKQFGPQLNKDFHKLVPQVTNDGVPLQQGGPVRLEQIAKQRSKTHPNNGNLPKWVGERQDYDSHDSGEDEDEDEKEEEDTDEEAEEMRAAAKAAKDEDGGGDGGEEAEAEGEDDEADGGKGKENDKEEEEEQVLSLAPKRKGRSRRGN